MSNVDNKFENIQFNEDSFKLVNEEKKIYDQKFETKPTTFIKDAFKRFCKNKSSVAGAIILGILILLAVFVPMFSIHEVEEPRIPQRMLAPKLFEAGTGFWDGTVEKTHIIYDVDEKKPADFYAPAVSNLVVSEPEYLHSAHKYAKGGYLHLNNVSNPTATNPEAITYLYSYPTTMTAAGNYNVEIIFGDEEGLFEAYLGEYNVSLKYKLTDDPKAADQTVLLKDFSKDYSKQTFNLSEKLKEAGVTTAYNARLYIELKGAKDYNTYLLIEKCIFTSDDENEDLAVISINDANRSVLYNKDDQGNFPLGYWWSTAQKNVYKATIYYCSFTLDTYLNAFNKTEKDIAYSTMQDYIKQGWCTYDTKTGEFVKLSDKCPVDNVVGQKTNAIGKVTEITVEIYRYREYGYDRMPIFLFGTDTYGHDIFTKAFKGLRTSLILGVCTCAFCLLFGLCWGAISGYFGGNVDLAMERFCEILGGVPWIVVMTLCILHLGNNFLTFFLALCLTGWMGTAGRTRTQFYRFKGREYVLASRTLGASDMRLIFRHILPNALGTIVTGAVLMIPSVIFSESTLAYLNLGLQGVQSFGVMLSENQKYISTDPHLIVFPATILALIMISFNLFGNGLRDALNPSLKGSE